jgi:hypothetical protein
MEALSVPATILSQSSPPTGVILAGVNKKQQKRSPRQTFLTIPTERGGEVAQGVEVVVESDRAMEIWGRDSLSLVPSTRLAGWEEKRPTLKPSSIRAW